MIGSDIGALFGTGIAVNNSIIKLIKRKGDCAMENVKVIIWGLGAMGGGIADMLLSKKGVDIAGAADMGQKVGTSMYDHIKTERGGRPEIIVSEAEEIISRELRT